jgi:hypothetical protein
MTDTEAIEFLKTVQPMPDDGELPEETIRQFEEARRHFVKSPNELAVPLLLNAFGSGDGFGVYQLVEDTLSNIHENLVIEHLAKALSSPHPGVRYWNCQISANYNDRRLIEPIKLLSRDESSDIRTAAAISLAKYRDEDTLAHLRLARSHETNEEIIKIYNLVIDRMACELKEEHSRPIDLGRGSHVS